MQDIPRQFALFFGAGLVSAIGHYGLLIALVQALNVEPVRASVAGAMLGGWINYAMNYRYTFRSDKRHRESGVKFALVAAAGLILNTVSMWLGVNVMDIHYLLCQLVTTAVVMLWSFGANRYWTFHSEGD
jgi:putative flippase GtrA